MRGADCQTTAMVSAGHPLRLIRPMVDAAQQRLSSTFDKLYAAGGRDFHGKKRSNETHSSTTDPDARLARQSNGQAARPCYAGPVVMKNRHGLVAGEATMLATGTAGRDAGQAMMAPLARPGRTTLGADRNHDTQGFVAAMRALGVGRLAIGIPHLAHRPTKPARLG